MLKKYITKEDAVFSFIPDAVLPVSWERINGETRKFEDEYDSHSIWFTFVSEETIEVERVTWSGALWNTLLLGVLVSFLLSVIATLVVLKIFDYHFKEIEKDAIHIRNHLVLDRHKRIHQNGDDDNSDNEDDGDYALDCNKDAD